MMDVELCKICGYLFGWTRITGSSIWVDVPRGESMTHHRVGHETVKLNG